MTLRTVDELKEKWQSVITLCRSNEAASLLYTAKPVILFDNGAITQIVLETRYPFHRNRMLDTDIQWHIRTALVAVVGANIVLDVRIAGEHDKAATRGTAVRTYRPSARRGPVRSIPTVYKGIQFRSKLEATTAELLDRVEIEWMFEEEGFDLSGVWYLPDFYLPDNRMVLEVKGLLDGRSETKVTRLAAACAPLGIHVMLLKNPRKRRVAEDMPLYVCGDLVQAEGILPNGVVLALCPSCRRAAWKLTRAKTCPLCGRAEDSPWKFGAIA
ncbi:MAG: hypothetical protein ACXWQ5_00825 [Ktedonobacterales bacterium]